MGDVPRGHSHHRGRGSHWEVTGPGRCQRRRGGVAAQAGEERGWRFGQVWQGKSGGGTPAADVCQGLQALVDATGSHLACYSGLLCFYVCSSRSQLLASGCRDWCSSYSASRAWSQCHLLAVQSAAVGLRGFLRLSIHWGRSGTVCAAWRQFTGR